MADSIESLLIDTINAKLPSVEVPEKFKERMKPSVALKFFVDVQLELLETLLTKTNQMVETNPDFDVNNNEHMSKMIKELNLFKVKVDFITKNGPQMP